MRTDKSARAQAETLFKKWEQQRADAPTALEKYRASQEAARHQMLKLRELRHAREARAAREA